MKKVTYSPILLAVILAACNGGSSDTTKEDTVTGVETAQLTQQVEKASIVVDRGDLWSLNINEEQTEVTLEVIDGVYGVEELQIFTVENINKVDDSDVLALTATENDIDFGGELIISDSGRWTYQGTVLRTETEDGNEKKSTLAVTADGSQNKVADIKSMAGLYNTVESSFKYQTDLTFDDYDISKLKPVPDSLERSGGFFPVQQKLVPTDTPIAGEIKQIFCFEGDVNPDATDADNACVDNSGDPETSDVGRFKLTESGIIEQRLIGLTKEGQSEQKLVLSNFTGDKLESFSADVVFMNDFCLENRDENCLVNIGKAYYVPVEKIADDFFEQGTEFQCSAGGLDYGKFTVNANLNSITFTASDNLGSYVKGQLVGEFEGEGPSQEPDSIDNTGVKGLYNIILNKEPNSDYESNKQNSNGNEGIALYTKDNYSTDVIDATGVITFEKRFTPEPIDRTDGFGNEYEDIGETRLHVLPINKSTLLVQGLIDEDRYTAKYRPTSVNVLICTQ